MKKSKLTTFTLCMSFVCLFSIISCDDGFKSYSNDNVKRPTVPDAYGNNPSDEEVYDNRGKDRHKPVSEHTDSVMKKNHTGVGHDQH